MLNRRFEALVADWDGTMVPDRAADAHRVRRVVEDLAGVGFDIVLITGTHVGNVDGQLKARPRGPGRLIMCVNRGSEVFACDESGPHLLYRRVAAADEERQLDAAAALTVERLRDLGLDASIIAQRLNRRKIDLIPLSEWSDPPKSDIARLLNAVGERLHAAGIGSIGDVVAIAHAAATEVGLSAARITTDAKHVEIGLTDKADAARWAFADLWAHGIAAGDVLAAGDEFGAMGGVPGSDALILVAESAGCVAVTVGPEPFGPPPGVLALAGGPDAILDLLDDQLLRRRRGEPPAPHPAAEWRVVIDGVEAPLESARAAVLTTADGRIGTTGAPILSTGDVEPETRASTLYTGEGSAEALQVLPASSRLSGQLEAPGSLRRVLDLHSGVLLHEAREPDGRLRAITFPALAEPGTAVIRAACWGQDLGERIALAPLPELPAERPDAMNVAVRDERRRSHDGVTVLDRVAVYSREGAASGTARARAAHERGFDANHRAHREAWARRWAHADVRIDGDPELQRNVRYSLFQLMAATPTDGDGALGARGLSGPGYGGHVFWDTDVFALPFLAATWPPAARALLEYRLRRLGAALEEARERGHDGAKFPWESARSGREVTPPMVRGPRGEEVRVLTAEMENHIVADVAWAACRYADWSADERFRRGPLIRLLVETARYWASRIERDGDGSAHIRHVIGPDEYHEDVDDNAFTNVMARWNLRAAAERAGSECAPRERRTWLALADSLVDGLDPTTLIYEQFSGFSRLSTFPLREIYGPGTLAADSLIGFERIRALQVVKQPDVLMLHQMVPAEVAPGSLSPNLDRYLPMTAHGSSLSPGVHAGLLARASRESDALDLLRLAARLDIDDVTGSTRTGLHIATMGSVWSAIAEGFAGIRVEDDGLVVRPHLPENWDTLALRLSYRGVHVGVRISHQGVHVETDRPLRVTVSGD